MRNEKVLLFEDITVEQTELLLGSIDTLPLSKSVARRIRGRVLENGKQRSHRRKRKQVARVLIPIAACLIAIVLLFTAFPKAAYAVSAFFGRVFTPSRYMNEDPAERTPVPSIDEAIAAAAPKDGDCRIEYITERPNAEEVLDSRAPNGLAPYNEKDWLWMADIRPEIAEVLYDGNQLMWNTNLYTDNIHVREFMEDYGIESGSKFAVDALVEDCSYTIEGDPTVYPLCSSGGGIQPIFTDEELAQADHVVLNTDFTLNDDERPLPSGVLTITQEIVLYQLSRGIGQSPVAFLYHTFTFDTTKGNTGSAAAKESDIPLSGETYLTVMYSYVPETPEDDFMAIETKKVSLDGVVLHAKYEYLSTGISVVITVAAAPQDWTSEMKDALLMMTTRDINDKLTSPGVAADLYINGTYVSEAPMPDGWGNGEQRYILPIYPEQYASTQSVSLKLTQVYYDTLNGTNQLAGEVFSASPSDMDQSSESRGIETIGTCQTIPLIEIPVPLP